MSTNSYSCILPAASSCKYSIFPCFLLDAGGDSADPVGKKDNFKLNLFPSLEESTDVASSSTLDAIPIKSRVLTHTIDVSGKKRNENITNLMKVCVSTAKLSPHLTLVFHRVTLPCLLVFQDMDIKDSVEADDGGDDLLDLLDAADS